MVSEKLVKFGASAFRRVWTMPSIHHGIKKARKLEKAGGGAILNLLGEHHNDFESVKNDVDQYRNLANAIKIEGVNARISIKPTQFGFDLKTDESRKQVSREIILKRTKERMWDIVDHATRLGIQVEMDVEHSGTHDFTFDAYREFCKKLKASKRGGMLGLAVQANYDRSITDVQKLADLDEGTYGRMRLRLVKGIYTPAKGDKFAYGPEKEGKLMENYRRMIDIAAASSNIDVAVGTHRNDIVQYALSKSAHAEAQALLGIRYPFKRGLRKQGIPVWDYVPIGSSKAAGEYASRRAGKAVQLGWSTFTDFFRPSIWSGKWLPEKQRRK